MEKKNQIKNKRVIRDGIIYGELKRDDPRISQIHFSPAEVGVTLANGSNMCSVVSVALALNISLDEAYERMMFIGYERHMLLNAIPVITEVLHDEYTYYGSSFVRKNGKSMTVLDLLTSDPNNDGYVILIYAHAFYCHGTTIFDGQNRYCDDEVTYTLSSERRQFNRLNSIVQRYYKKENGITKK